MISILKRGRRDYKDLVKFRCNNCGCIWIANRTEDCVINYNHHSTPAMCDCPECGKSAEQLQGEEGKINVYDY